MMKPLNDLRSLSLDHSSCAQAEKEILRPLDRAALTPVDNIAEFSIADCSIVFEVILLEYQVFFAG